MKPVPEMTLEDRGHAIRQLKRMIRKIGAMYLGTDHQREEFVRASGLAICPECGLEYIEHPVIADMVLHLACDGTLLKL